MKKFLASMLALMLLVMPFAGVAESVPASALDMVGEEATDYYADALAAGRRVNYSVSLSGVATDFTGEPAVDQVIADVLNALVFTGYMQGDEVYYAISMKQDNGKVADLLTMGVAVMGDDAYILSNLIGGTIVVGADEVVPVLERLVDMLVMIGFIPENEVESIKAQLPEMWEMVKEEFAAGMASANAMAELDPATFDYTALTGIATTLMSKMVNGEPDILPKNCDTAVSMVTLTLTPEEMNGLVASAFQFLKDNPALSDAVAAEIDFDNTFAPEFSGVSGEPITFDGFLDMMIAEMAENQIYAGDVVYRIWLDADGMPVAADMTAPIANGDETITVTLNYTRLTVNDGVAHSFVISFPGGDITLNALVKEKSGTITFAVAENGEVRIDAKIEYTDRSAENLIAADVVVDMTVTEANVSVQGYYYVGDEMTTVPVAEEENTTINLRVAMSSDTAFDGVDFVEKDAITFSYNGKEYFTVDVLCETTDAGESIMTGDVVRPAELSDADFANWFVNVYTAAYTWVQNAIFAMPSSLINLLNTGF